MQNSPENANRRTMLVDDDKAVRLVTFDLVLLDLAMPTLSGMEVFSALQQR